MAFKYKNRVRETTTTTGTGTLTLLGAMTGFQSFSAIGNGNTCVFCIEQVDVNGVPTGSWEVSYGTYTSAGTTLSRSVILESSNSNAAVNFAAGTKNVYVFESADAINSYVLIQDNQAANAGGGTFTLGAWRTRTLNSIISDDAGLVTLALNQITFLKAGIYVCDISCPAYLVGRHKARLYDISNAVVFLDGTSAYANTTDGWSRSEIHGPLIVGANAIAEVQHQCETTRATDGFGSATNFAATEVYTSAIFRKVA